MANFLVSVSIFLKKVSILFSVVIAALIAFFFEPQRHAYLSNELYYPVGTMLILVGMYIRIWVRGYDRSEGFVIDGPYRYVRNPVELGTTIIFWGVSVALALLWWQQALVVFAAVILFELQSIGQEEIMRRAVGEKFERYKRRVRRWVPSRYPGMNRSSVSYSLTRGLIYERDLLVFAVALVASMALKKNLGL